MARTRRIRQVWVAGMSLLLLPAMAACGDDDGRQLAGAGGGASASGSGVGGAGGDAGCNSGPVMGAFDDVHGCTVETATDRRCEAAVTIDGGFIDSEFKYDPKCLLVSAGTTVTITNADGTNFQIHPLRGGTTSQEDPASPFGFINDTNLTEASFDLDTPGTYPYICVAHAGSGMIGVVYVE